MEKIKIPNSTIMQFYRTDNSILRNNLSTLTININDMQRYFNEYPGVIVTKIQY